MIAKKREKHWELMRWSIEYLKQHETKWRTRRIIECERTKEEEKKDKLAIVSEKRKRCGLKRLNKEENMRLKSRTEERIEIAQATANYWKWYREDGRIERTGDSSMEGVGEKREVWNRLRAEISALEEDGVWIQEEDALRRTDDEGVIRGGDDDDKEKHEDEVRSNEIDEVRDEVKKDVEEEVAGDDEDRRSRRYEMKDDSDEDRRMRMMMTRGSMNSEWIKEVR